MEEAGPRSGSFHWLNAHTIFLSGDTSRTCTEPGQFFASIPVAPRKIDQLACSRDHGTTFG